MRTRRTTTIEKLRLAIDCLPRSTRRAMLDGIGANSIIVGAYSTGEGICPMLAAHRAGGRTDCISFAKAWDRFALAGSRRADPRRATQRELRVLTAHLEMSLLEEETASAGLAGAIAEHRALVGARPVSSDPAGSDHAAPDHAGPDHAGADRSGADAAGAADEVKAGHKISRRRRPGDPDRAPELRQTPGWAWTRVVRRYDDFQDTLREAQSATARERTPA